MSRFSMLCVCFVLVNCPVAAEDIRFPASAGLIDLTKAPYGAVGNGIHDDTAAIQRALDEHSASGAILYLPNGIYLISHTLHWGGGPGEQRFTVLQGESQSRTILRLKDACTGFIDPSHPEAMVNTGGSPAQRFRNQIRNCTWDTGHGNPGAIGVRFNASNVGCLRNVTIRSGDGRGVIGLDQSYADDFGPCYVKNVTIEGFDTGIAVAHAVNGVVYDHICLKDQRKVGWINDGMPITILALTSIDAVPVLVNRQWNGLVTLVGARLRGTGAASRMTAIRNGSGGMYVRNLQVSGYAHALEDDGQRGSDSPRYLNVRQVSEWSSVKLPGSAPGSLGLPFPETPDIPWDHLQEWAVITDYGAKMDGRTDDSDALQRAIDSGKTTVCLPRGHLLLGKPVILRGRVRRLIGCETFVGMSPSLRGVQAALIVGTSPEPTLVVERFASFFWDNHAGVPLIANPTNRTLVLRDLGDVDDTSDEFPNGRGVLVSGPGRWFLEDVTGRFHLLPGSRLWARYVNPETNQDHRNSRPDAAWHLINDGGQLWVGGIKTEGPGPVVITRAGGRTELLGGLMYSSGGARTQDQPSFLVEDPLHGPASRLSVSIDEANFSQNRYPVLVQVQRGKNVTFQLLPGQTLSSAGGSMIPLWSSPTQNSARDVAAEHRW